MSQHIFLPALSRASAVFTCSSYRAGSRVTLCIHIHLDFPPSTQVWLRTLYSLRILSAKWHDTTLSSSPYLSHKEIAEVNFALHESHCSRFLCLCPDCNEAVPRDQLEEHREEQHAEVYAQESTLFTYINLMGFITALMRDTKRVMSGGWWEGNVAVLLVISMCLHSVIVYTFA